MLSKGLRKTGVKIWILFGLVPLLIGCTSQTAKTEIPLTEMATPMSTLSPPVKETPTAVHTSTLEPVFSISQNCPLDRFVLDSYPGYSSNVSLITLVDNKVALINLTNGIATIYDQAVISNDILVASPDGKHISYLSSDGTEEELWIFAPSTGEMAKSFSVPPDTVLLSWIANDKIALWSYPDVSVCEEYSGFFDLTTESVIQPKNRSIGLDQSRCRLFPSISSDGLKAFYPWQVKDLNTGITSDVHLIDDVTTDPPYYLLDWFEDTISIVSFMENTLLYGLDFPVDELDDQPIKLQGVQMPAFATKSYYWMPPIIGSDLSFFGWDLIGKDTDVSGYYVDLSKGNLPTNFYTINLDTTQFTNYCLDRSIPYNQEKNALAKPVQRGYFSPDGRYLAWTIYSTADFTPPIETQVLNLETGKVIVLNDIETFGWAIP